MPDEKPSAIEFLTGSTANPQANPLTPETSAAMRNAPSISISNSDGMKIPMQVLTPAQTQESQFNQANQQGGVQMESENGVDALTRVRLSFQRGMQEQIGVLQKKYGNDAVRLSTEGEPIVRVMDPETGKPKDILVNEKGLSAGDFLSIASSIPEIAGSIIALRAGKAVPALEKLFGMKGALRDIGTTAIGAETAGAGKDVVARMVEGIPIRPGEIVTERAKGAVVDAALGSVFAGGAGAIKYLQSPFAGSRGKLQFDALKAKQYFKDEYGIDVPLSIGESTGSSLFQRAESMAEAMPGGQGPLSAARATQEQSLRDLQDIIVGPKGVEAVEDVGQRVIDDLKGKLQGVKNSATGTRAAVASEAGQAIEQNISNLTTPQKQLYKTEIGNQIREKVTAFRDSAKAESNNLYEAVKAAPGGVGDTFPVTGLSSDAQSLIKRLPAKQTITQTPSPILGVSGQPAAIKTTTGKEVMREFVPENILARLKQLSELKGNVSLSDLQQMRREVYDDIEKGSGVPGLGTHYLSEVGTMLTKSIEDGVAAMPGGELKNALKAANEFYKKKVVPFSDNDITNLFVKSNEGGYQGNFATASKFMKNPDAFIRLRDALGANSPEFKNLKRGIADDLIENAKIPGTDQVDGNAFLKGLETFRKTSREVSDEVLGKDTTGLAMQARAMALGQGARIDEELAQEIIATGKINPARIRIAVAAQRNADELFRNDIFSAIGKGEHPAITADEFIGKLLDNTNPKGIREVLGALSNKPELLEEIRAKTIQKVFSDNARASTVDQVSRSLEGEKTRLVSATKIGEYLNKEGGSMRDKLNLILGSKGYDELDKYVKLQLVPESKDLAFKGAGGLGASAAVSQVMRFGPLKYLDTAAKFFIESKFLSNPVARKWLSSVPSNDIYTLAQYLIVSTPFLEAATKEFGNDGAKALMVNIKKSMDTWGEEQANKPKETQQSAPKKSVAEFLSIPNTNK